MVRFANRKVLIQYMSDLHLERIGYEFTIIKVAPTLILGGDIGRFCDYDLYRNFLSTLCGEFDLVLLIAGNHEFYGSTRAEGLDAALKLVHEPSMCGKLRFLNRGKVDLPGSNVTVLGCTLHSHIDMGSTRLTNDFVRIRDWCVTAHNDEHTKDLDWLKESLRQLEQAEPKRQVVIATHYAPMFHGVCHPLNEKNAVSQCFSSYALDSMRKSGGTRIVSYWVFGHTHWNAKIKADKLTLLSNQLCNDGERLSWWQKRRLYMPFKPEAVIQVSPQNVSRRRMQVRISKLAI